MPGVSVNNMGRKNQDFGGKTHAQDFGGKLKCYGTVIPKFLGAKYNKKLTWSIFFPKKLGAKSQKGNCHSRAAPKTPASEYIMRMHNHKLTVYSTVAHYFLTLIFSVKFSSPRSFMDPFGIQFLEQQVENGSERRKRSALTKQIAKEEVRTNCSLHYLYLSYRKQCVICSQAAREAAKMKVSKFKFDDPALRCCKHQCFLGGIPRIVLESIRWLSVLNAAKLHPTRMLGIFLRIKRIDLVDNYCDVQPDQRAVHLPFGMRCDVYDLYLR